VELRQLMTELLTSVTPKILQAGDGREALQILKSQPVDAVISDISMPKMNGLQLLAEVRDLGIQTPFVILTGFADRENILEALRLDAADFLEKPFDPKRMEEITIKVLELGHWLREMESEVDSLFATSEIPADKLARLKYIKKAIHGTRITRHINGKKAA
jgi:YesN/AraC family two-component response regulator